jgi:hypothetical protein
MEELSAVEPALADLVDLHFFADTPSRKSPSCAAYRSAPSSAIGESARLLLYRVLPTEPEPTLGNHSTHDKARRDRPALC